MNQFAITINGQPMQIASTDLKGLLNQLSLSTQNVAIAINNDVIPSSDYDHTNLKAGDCIEIIQAVCGG